MKKLSKQFILLAILFGLSLGFKVSAALVVSDDPALDLNSFVVVGLQVAQFILGIVGALTLLMFVYGGFMWIASGGSSDKVQKGKDIIVGAVVGLLIVFSSYMIVSYVSNDILQAKKRDSSGAAIGDLFSDKAPESTTSQTPCKAAGGACVLGSSCKNIKLNVEKSECRQNYVCCSSQPACTAVSGQKCVESCSETETQGVGICGESGKVCCKTMPACSTIGSCMPKEFCPDARIRYGYFGCSSPQVCCFID